MRFGPVIGPRRRRLTPLTDAVIVGGAMARGATDRSRRTWVSTTPDLGEGRPSSSAGDGTGGGGGGLRATDLRVRGLRGAGPDVVGVLFVVAAALVTLIPALRHGGALGPYDLLSRYGVLKQSGVSVHNSQTTDLIAEMIPWTSLAWTQVHHGHLPLWNPTTAWGCRWPSIWQSAVFGLPTLVSYLAPLRFGVHGASRGHLGGGGYRHLRPRACPLPRCHGLRHGGGRVRAERLVHGLRGMADRVGDGVDGVDIRGRRPHRPGRRRVRAGGVLRRVGGWRRVRRTTRCPRPTGSGRARLRGGPDRIARPVERRRPCRFPPRGGRGAGHRGGGALAAPLILPGVPLTTGSVSSTRRGPTAPCRRTTS